MKLYQLYAGIALLVFGLVYGVSGLYEVDPGETALEIKMLGSNPGIQDKPVLTGTHWVDPIAYDIAVYDTRLKQYKLDDVPSSTKDGQPITVDMSVELGLIDKSVKELHQNIGPDYYNQVVYPALRSSLRNTTTQELSDEIYTGDGRAHVQKTVQELMEKKLNPLGMRITINLRDIEFTNADFVATLENKAKAAQQVLIEQRKAEAAAQTAIAVANKAEGEKQKQIKEAEAAAESKRLDGIGERQKLEQVARGNLAIAKAKAAGTKLQVLAYGSGKTYASVKWAESLGPKLTIWGVPTGAKGTSTLMDLNGILNNAFTGKGPNAAAAAKE